MDPKFPAMMTVNINFDDRGIVILKNNGNRDLNMINVVWKKKKKNFTLLYKNYDDVIPQKMRINPEIESK